MVLDRRTLNTLHRPRPRWHNIRHLMDRPRAKPIPPPIKGNVQKARLDNSSNFASLESTIRSQNSKRILVQIEIWNFSNDYQRFFPPRHDRSKLCKNFPQINFRNRKFLSQNFLLRTKTGKFSQREESHVFTEGVPLLSEERRNSEQSYGQVHMYARVYTLSYITHIYIRNGLKIQVTEAPCSGSRV